MTQAFRFEETARPISNGDVGIVIAPDNSFFIFNAHDNFDPAAMSSEQAEQGAVLEALVVALKFPQVMDVLKRMANDPSLVTTEH